MALSKRKGNNYTSIPVRCLSCNRRSSIITILLPDIWMSEYLFSYGILQRKEVQMKLYGRILEGSVDILKGYTTTTIRILDEAFLSRGEQKQQQTAMKSDSQTDSIKGTVFEITVDELLLSDSYEPENYKRINVVLESGRESWIYLAM